MAKRWSEMLGEFEGRFAFMYLDGAGVVTCGEGHALQTREAAILVFGSESAGNDWEKVRAMTPGRVAALYSSATRSRLTDSQIDSLRDQDVARFTAELRAKHPESEQWPVGPHDACLDILYNTGLVFSHMVENIQAQNWSAAATNAHRIEHPAPNGIQPSRNAWAKEAVLSAHVGVAI